ncbi:MAG: hypothetical protein V1792_16550 [Pseudomonadota bacterium]
MGKIVRLMVVVIALAAFGLATQAVAAEYFVVKDASGKALSVTDTKPADAKMVAAGPFKTKQEAENALQQAAGSAGKAQDTQKKPVKPPDEGC